MKDARPRPGRTGAAPLRTLRWLAAVSVLAPLTLLAFGARQSYRHHVHEARQAVRRTVDVVAEHAGRVFDVQEQVIGRVDERVRGMTWDQISGSEDLHRDLRRIDDEVEQIDVIWLIGPQGRGRNSSAFFPAPASSTVADRDYFLALKERDAGLFVGASSPGRSSSERLFFNVARRRSSASGAFDGLIVTSLSPAHFAGFYRSLVVSPQDSVALVRSDGAVLARGPEPLEQALALAPTNLLVQRMATSEQGSYRTAAQIDGTERLFGYKKLANYPVFAVYGVSWNAVLGAWYRDIALYGAVALGAMLSLLGTTGLAVRRTREERRAFHRWRTEVLERERAEAAVQHKDVLLRELSHRVMNSLQTIASLFALQAKTLRDAEARRQFGQAIGRINSMALAYRRMQAADGVETIDFATFVAELCQDLQGSLLPEGHVIAVETEAIRLGPDQAVPLALVVNELVTNAVKHGSGIGPIRVTLGRSADGCRLAVRSHGVLPDGFDASRTKGFGMRMVAATAAQLDGRLEAASAAGETEFAVTFRPKAPQPTALGTLDADPGRAASA